MRNLSKTLNILLRFYLYAHYLAFAYFAFSFLVVAFPFALLITYPFYYFTFAVPIGPLPLQLIFTFLGIWSIMTLLGLGYLTSLTTKLCIIAIWIVIFALKVFVCVRFLREETILNIRLSKLSLMYTTVISLIPIVLVILSYCIGGSSYGDITFVLSYILAIIVSVTIYSFAIDLTLLSYVKFYKIVKYRVFSSFVPAFLIVWTIAIWLIYPFIIHIPPKLTWIIVITWPTITILQILIVVSLIRNLRKTKQ